MTLDFKNAPKTSINFLNYALDGFYEGTIFHRVIKGFVVQGGGLDSDMLEKKSGQAIQNEANPNTKNNRGTVAMARTNAPHSATTQFFINLKDNDFLNFKKKTPDLWGYCAFAKVVSGMDIVDQIAEVPVTNKMMHQDVPEEAIVIESVHVQIEALPEKIQAAIQASDSEDE